MAAAVLQQNPNSQVEQKAKDNAAVFLAGGGDAEMIALERGVPHAPKGTIPALTAAASSSTAASSSSGKGKGQTPKSKSPAPKAKSPTPKAKPKPSSAPVPKKGKGGKAAK